MKKVILLAAGVLMIASCSKNGDQIDASKKKLTDLGIDKEVVEKLKFEVHEVLDKDVYKKIAKNLQDDVEDLKDVAAYDAAIKKQKEIFKYVDLQGKASNKTFHIVDAYRVEGDTLNKSQLYLDDKNAVIDFIIYK